MQAVKVANFGAHYSSFSGQQLSDAVYRKERFSHRNVHSGAERLNRFIVASSEKHGNNSPSGSGPGSYKIPSWEMLFRNIQFQEAAARMRLPLRNIVSNTSKRIQRFVGRNRSSEPRKESTKTVVAPEPKTSEVRIENVKLETAEQESDWEEWLRYIAEIEERDNLISTLKFQLEDAIDEEDFEQASKLKKTIDTLSSYDAMSEAMDDLKIALEDEDYKEATHLRDEAGIGLIGWWVANAKDLNDPFGKIVNISPSQGRLLAKSYTSRQLITAGEGTPIFEIFVKKGGDLGYKYQPVYLKRESETGPLNPVSVIDADANTFTKKRAGINFSDSSDKSNNFNGRPSISNPSDSQGSIKNLNQDLAKSQDSALDNLNENLSSEETIKKVVGFLREHIPGAKFKVFQIKSNDSIEGLREIDIDDELDSEETEIQNLSDNDIGMKKNGTESIPEDIRRKREDKAEEKDSNGLAIGVIFKETPSTDKDELVMKLPDRIPAKIIKDTRDAFTFCIGTESKEIEIGRPGKRSDQVIGVSKINSPSSVSPTPLSTSKSELLKEVLANKTSSKVPSKMAEILKLAISHAQLRKGLSSQTSFKRIEVEESNLDPFSGLFLGAFGPHTSEAVQINRKFGRWENDPSISSSENNKNTLEDLSLPYEYVEATKLTGDFNVPSGQVTFRAKISKQYRLSSNGVYPEGLGVVARYKGQGMLAEPGFKNPQWIDGELLLLDGKSSMHTNGAELGFVYSMPEKNFLVLFNRLNLKC